MIYLDTSVIVPAVQAFDPRHEAAARLLASCTPANAACGDHTISELYSTLTGSPKPFKLAPRDTLAIIERVVQHVALVSLNAEEVMTTMRSAAAVGVAGGTVYDALLMTRARKISAEAVYTFNVRHFRLVAPDLAFLIRQP